MLDWQIFRGLPESELRRLVPVARRRRFERREVVFHQGDPADTLHLVSQGHFAARIGTRLGDTTTLSVHGPGEAFGELAIVEPDSVRSTTVAALEASETYAVHYTDFGRLRRQYPSVNDLLAEALFVSAETRVRRRLLEVAELYSDGVVPLRQEDLAGLAGTSRATVNRVLRAEAARGTLELGRGKTVVLDAGALARRASSPLL